MQPNCPRCGSVLSGQLCANCGMVTEEPLRGKLGSSASSVFRWMRRHPRLAIWIVILVVGGLYSLVDENVDFFQKHVPSLNAAIHSGDITTTGDAVYDVDKWVDDLSKLNSDLKSQSWPDMRREILARKAYLGDLVERDNKFQQRINIEASQHLDVGDQCESLAIHQAAPLMERYTQLLVRFYSLTKSTKLRTPDASRQFEQIDTEQSQIDQQLADYAKHSQAAGCK